MRKKHILICAPFVTFPGEPGSNRFIAIARKLAETYNVTLITSRFSHSIKKHRYDIPYLKDVRVVMLDEPGYKKNLGYARVKSHWYFCQNLKKYLRNDDVFDLVYSAFPLVQTNLILKKLCVNKSIPFLVDVQDVWPEAISGAIPWLSGKIGRFLMLPLTARSNAVYAAANGLIAVSETYLKRANISNLTSQYKAVVYLGSDKIWFNEDETLSIRDTSRPLKAVYLGTLGGSYDVETIVRAAARIPNVDIEVIGYGPNEKGLRLLNDQLGAPVSFTGALSHDEAMRRTMQADVAINAIKGQALQSITNKLSDYFCAGLPIISSQNNEEVKELLSIGGGVSYIPGDVDSLANVLSKLASDPGKLMDMALCNRRLARELFYRPKTYKRIVDLVDSILRTDVNSDDIAK